MNVDDTLCINLPTADLHKVPYY